MDVLVVGAGAIGRWFGRVLSESEGFGSGDEIQLVYYDEQQAVAAEAADETGGRVLSAEDGQFDLVCIAVPIPVATAAIAEHADRARSAIVDVTGTMTNPVDAMTRHALNVERCSLHPLFAPGNEPGNVPMVVVEGGPVTKFLRQTLEARGNHVFETTPAEHDDAMKTAQAQVHAAILAYGVAGEPVPERFQTTVSRELSALLDQVTGGEARVYADIQEAFDGADAVATAVATIAQADKEEFEELYDRIRRDRT